MSKIYRNKLTVGCIVVKSESILLVKHAYGPTKGKWDFPKGYVEIEETIDAAAVREVLEETSVTVKPTKVIGIRHQVEHRSSGEIVNDIMILWLLNYEGGEPIPDGKEVSTAAFIQKADILNSLEYGNWLKEIIKSLHSERGLTKSGYQSNNKPTSIKKWVYHSS